MSTLPPFQSVLDAIGPAVHRYLVVCVGAAEADDCFQETMLSALRGYPGVRDAASVRGWLFTIAHRKVVDAHRARQRRPVPVEQVEPAASSDADRLDAEPLWAAVRRLPERQRAAVVHRFVNDLPYRDVARVMGCSEVAARQSVHAGVQRLREEGALDG